MATERRCLHCPGAMTRTVSDHAYVEAGLPNILLQNVSIWTCGSCGNKQIGLPRLTEIHRGLAMAFVGQSGPLRAEQIRFLRKFLGLSRTDLATHLGINKNALTSWERGVGQMDPTSDRLLREQARAVLGLEPDSMRPGPG